MADEAVGLDPRRWWTLLVLCLCITVIGVDNTILNVALPSIVRDLGASGTQLQWIVAGYTIVFACLLLTAGSLGDRFGRKGTLGFGLAWFGIFSALASQATSPGQLIVARGLMGVGGAFIFPTTLSILTNTFSEPAERARAIGIWAGVSGIGIAVGPLAGGLLVEHFGWASVFFINVPICAAAVLLVRAVVPRIPSSSDSPLDPAGAALSILALVPLLYAIIEAPDRGWADGIVVASFGAGIVMLAVFALWERHTDDPMLDVAFFRDPRFSAASATITITFFALFASTFLLTQYFQFVLGYSPLKAGLLLTPVAVGLMVGGPLAPRGVERWGTKRVVAFGLVIVAACMACYGSDTLMSSFGFGIFVRFLWGFGMGITSAPVTESIMGSLPLHRAGVGSAVNDTTRQTGGALGVAVLGSIFLAHYHAAMGALGFLPEPQRRLARESVGTSLAIAGRLPPDLGLQLRHTARAAFLDAQRFTYTFGVSIILLALLVAWKFLPARPPAPSIVADERVDALAVAIEDIVG
ncbi:MAG: drug resistance transporter [Acidimicrobiales bacterium]|nr:drug resistance transporter [Acidimicrobiales bacterium]